MFMEDTEMTILMRRFTIVCLVFVIFAFAMSLVVNSAPRRAISSQISIAASCHPGSNCAAAR